jgi:twitching motility protein PilT
MDTINDILTSAVGQGASDVHLAAGVPPVFRVNGALKPWGTAPLSASDTKELTYSMMEEKHRIQLERKGEADFAYSVPAVGRFRANAFMQRGSIAAAVRALNTVIPDPSALGIPESVVEVTKRQRGLVLVTGPTGSGKSTTLASLINIITRITLIIITLEDPIEYLHSHKKTSSASGRWAPIPKITQTPCEPPPPGPDVILVGEMRDLETISIAVTAAETGLWYFPRCIPSAPAATIDRIIDVSRPTSSSRSDPAGDVLVSVVSQQLSPKKTAGGAARPSRSCTSIPP